MIELGDWRDVLPGTYDPARAVVITDPPFGLDGAEGRDRGYADTVPWARHVAEVLELLPAVRHVIRGPASLIVFQPAPCAHPAGERAITITGRSFISSTRTVGRHSRQTTHAFAGRLMGIDWMTRDELGQAIPPAYTEWLGLELMRELVRVA